MVFWIDLFLGKFWKHVDRFRLLNDLAQGCQTTALSLYPFSMFRRLKRFLARLSTWHANLDDFVLLGVATKLENSGPLFQWSILLSPW